MLNAPLLVILSAAYLGLLFFIAWRGDKKPVGEYSRFQPFLFTLSLAVYCSSWTFYGAVGTAANQGWNFFPIYLGPILVFIFGHRFLRKLVGIAKRQKTTSIADFLASRHGNSRSLAALVSILALIGSIPYIALQLKAVSSSFNSLAGITAVTASPSAFADTALYVSLAMALFSVLFGVRRIDATEHHRGMIHAISFESLVKLTALLLLALFSLSLLSGNELEGQLDQLAANSFNFVRVDVNFITTTLLSACAIVCLPRQFQVLAVESRGDEISGARWGFPLYLVLISIAVIPITLAGLGLFHSPADADLFVLNIPSSNGSLTLATLMYLGGISAATGMVIVATVALSTMVSNDLVLPVVMRLRAGEKADYYPMLLQTRRITILGVMLLAFVYYRTASEVSALAGIGLLSFAAASQIAPAMVGGMFWRGGHRNGAIAGLLIGFGLWFYTLMIPTLAASGWLDSSILDGPFNLDWLRPNALFGISFGDQLSHGVFWSLTSNILAYILVSKLSNHNFADKLQAFAFVEGGETRINYLATVDRHITVSDIRELCDRFVGVERSMRFFDNYEMNNGAQRPQRPADSNLLKEAERLLASSIGSSSARNIIDSALQASGAKQSDLFDLLNQTTQAIQFNRGLLQATLDNLSLGISVVDKDLNLVAWNHRYLEMFQYPEGFIQVGMPVADVIRLNLQRGLLGDDNVDKEVSRRLTHMRNGTSYTTERLWHGRVLRFQGNPMPDGGFVTSFGDITDLKDTQNELLEINENLEQIVGERTQRLSDLNEQLNQAKIIAEDATQSKTRFLAAASHDLLQPLNAGKLFLGALLEELEEQPQQSHLANNALKSMQSAESLLRALLDISKLDAGALQPQREHFPLSRILQSLDTEFSVIAAEKGLRLRIVPCNAAVYSDQNLLRSILQNFIANALRYTSAGAVMVICRKRNDHLLIQVRDSGTGIPPQLQDEIFQEFRQLDAQNKQGLGLGLAITRRIADLLRHRIDLRSDSGLGSTFSVLVPLGEMPEHNVAVVTGSSKKAWLSGKSILCVDDERSILEASQHLLQRWGAEVTLAESFEQCLALHEDQQHFDLILADYRLGADKTGIDVLKLFCSSTCPGILISAEQQPTVASEAENIGCLFMRKPVEPAILRATISRIVRP